MDDMKRMINELTFQLHSKEVVQQQYSIQLSVTDANKILELLKEQKPIKPILERNSSFWAYYKCVACNEPVIYYQKYCSECGRKLEWK